MRSGNRDNLQLLRSVLRHSLALIALILVAVLGSSPVTATGTDQSETIAGHWEGTIAVPGLELRILVDLVSAEDGGWSGTIDIPLQNATGMPLENIVVDGDNVSFELMAGPGRAYFEGRFTPLDLSIDGEFRQATVTCPFSLAKGDPIAAGAATLEGFGAFIESILEPWQVPGVAVGIVQGKNILLADGFGLRDIEQQLPVTAETLFAIGSSSKAFTTLAIGILADEGLLDWDEPVRTYLPDFQMNDPVSTNRLTVLDLVIHRSGLPRHDGMWYNSPFSRRDIFERLRYLEPNLSFRESFQYQNLMFLTAGLVIEQVTGGTWEAAIGKHIFTPLGMNVSNFSVTDLQQCPDFALPYDVLDDELQAIPYRNIDNVAPAGAINSNLNDMLRWVRLHLSAGEIDGQRVISEAGLSFVHTPKIVVPVGEYEPETPLAAYAPGWFVQPYRGHAVLHHGGNIDGFSALVTFLPDDDLGLVVLTNRNGSPLPQVITRHALDLLLELDPIDWHTRRLTRFNLMREQADETEEQADPDQRQKTKPSHELDEYVGRFEHPGYGVVTITRPQKKVLAAEYNGMSASLEHFHYDYFVMRGGDDSILDGIKLCFLTGQNGAIDRLTTMLEPSVPELVFTRIPPSLFEQPELLADVQGEYEMSGMTATIALKGASILTLFVPGQPVYELEPTGLLEFRLADLPGFRVKFQRDDEGTITGITFIQPNGTFQATKK